LIASNQGARSRPPTSTNREQPPNKGENHDETEHERQEVHKSPGNDSCRVLPLTMSMISQIACMHEATEMFFMPTPVAEPIGNLRQLV
jgi:hypothetical protein